jgi:hypothetical protein
VIISYTFHSTVHNGALKCDANGEQAVRELFHISKELDEI